MHKFLADCPGLTGEVARYVYDRLEWDQPGMALGTAICFIGALRSGRFTNKFGIEPNMYCAIIAESGMGKSESQKAIRDLVDRAALDDPFTFLMGKPKSDSAILGALQESPRQLLIWDEFGVGLSAISNSQMSHEAMILAVMMDIHSSAGRKYIGSEYSRKSANYKRVDIKAPYLSILGGSTPNRFFGALNNDFINDGFLARWLVFVGEDQIRGKDSLRMPPDDMMVQAIKDIQKAGEKPGNLGEFVPHDTTEMRFELPDRAITAFKELCKSKVQDAKTSIHRVFYARLFEQTIRIATIMGTGRKCSEDCFFYAQALTEKLIEDMIQVCSDRIFNDTRQRSDINLRINIRDKFLALIPFGATMTKSEVTRKSQHWCDTNTRNNVIRDLVDTETWQETFQEPSLDSRSKRRPITYLRINSQEK